MSALLGDYKSWLLSFYPHNVAGEAVACPWSSNCLALQLQ